MESNETNSHSALRSTFVNNFRLFLPVVGKYAHIMWNYYKIIFKYYFISPEVKSTIH